MKRQRGDPERLLDVKEALDAIGRHPISTFDEFMENELVRYFAAKHIEIIGEAVCKISEEFKSQYPGIPWRAIEKTRHVLVHDYFEIDWKTIWDILETRLAALRLQIETILLQCGIHDSGEG